MFVLHVRTPLQVYLGCYILLALLGIWFPLSSLDMKQPTLKTVALVALTSAQRSQTLAALDVEKGSEFTVKEILETSKPRKSPVGVSLPAFPQNGKFCVHSTLSCYANSNVRQAVGTSKLFLSYGKPYKPVSSSITSRWQKIVLSMAGINTTIFKGQNFRGASTSKAVSQGVSKGDLLKTADWKNAGAFAKFYNRSSPISMFASAVLTP